MCASQQYSLQQFYVHLFCKLPQAHIIKAIFLSFKQPVVPTEPKYITRAGQAIRILPAVYITEILIQLSNQVNTKAVSYMT